ncbi:MAG: tetratricopeptide repeat protein, partial [Anaerolineae bacterium]
MWLERARAVYETLGDQQGLSEAVGGMGAVYWCQLDYPRALACFEQKLHIAKEVGDRQGASQAVGSMGVVYTELGDYSLALACYGQDLQIATELGDRLRIGKVVGNMGTVYLEQGDYRRGLACYEQQLQIAVESGDRFMTCVSVGNMVPVYAVQGDYSTADRLSRQAIVLGRALNIPLYLCEYLLNKADLYVRQRRYDAGQHLNHEALSVATQIERKDIQFLAEVLSVRLRARLHQIDMPAAIGKLEALLDEWPEDSQQAAVQYEIWRLDPTQATCRQNAADLYRDLYARTPNIKYRQRYTELTRDALPDPTPLPGLPEIVTQNPVDRDALLAQVDQMITELEG